MNNIIYLGPADALRTAQDILEPSYDPDQLAAAVAAGAALPLEEAVDLAHATLSAVAAENPPATVSE